MTTQEIANRLVELCKTGQNEQAYTELFADNAKAVEPAHSLTPGSEGKAALIEKARGFAMGIQEMHSSFISAPLVAGNFITLTMGMDVTFKDGNRMNMEEVCVYEVEDGKIIKEQFFF